MAYAGLYDVISLVLSLKLLTFSISAAVSDYWHPAFYGNGISSSLVLMMIMVFLAMILAMVCVLTNFLSVFVTEAVRSIAMVITGSCVFCHVLVLLLYSQNLISMASPWMLAMIATPMAVLATHQLLIQLKKLDNFPLYKLVLSCIMFVLCLLCVILKHWPAVEPGLGVFPSSTFSLFSLPSSGAASLLKAIVILTLLALLLLSALYGVEFAAQKKFLAASPISDGVSSYLCIGLSIASFLFASIGSIVYSSITSFTNSMLAAVCMTDSAMCILYQLFTLHGLPTD